MGEWADLPEKQQKSLYCKCLPTYYHAAFINALHTMQKGGMNNKSEMKINCVYHSYNQN